MSTLDLYDLAVGPPDPHQGPDRGYGWPGDTRWDPPADPGLVDRLPVANVPQPAPATPPPGYRYCRSAYDVNVVHLLDLVELDVSRTDGRVAVCGVADRADVADLAGATLCRTCSSLVTP